ncbi:MAG: hypothetical protein ACLP1X_30320 [Polyangiaceae bacterium]|jgi:hypothetical protein
MRADVDVRPFDALVGEVTTAPRGRVATLVLACTGLLLVLRVARLFGRLALAYRTPGEVAVSDDGSVRIRWRVEMLGRRLADRDVLVPRSGLVRAVREVRYPRLAFYAGLLALAAGSYVGVSSCIDGARAASPSLLLAGLSVVALGLAIDFVLSVVAPGTSGTCRVIFVPRDGAKLCVGAVEVSRADALMARLRQS